MDERLKKVIDESENIVFFGGAGVSTESNIPDFRSESGLYHAQEKYGYAPETMLSHSFYVNHTEMFFKYYKENLIYPEAQPNDAHKALAALEKRGKLRANAVNFMMLIISWMNLIVKKAFRTAAAADVLNLMWCFMRKC